MSKLGYAFGRDYGQYNHAVRRAKERYDIAFTLALNGRVAALINSGLIKPIEFQYTRYPIYEINWKDIDPERLDDIVSLAFDGETQNVVTFLPRDWTPEDGAEHYQKGKAVRVETARLAAIETARLLKEKAKTLFDFNHPMPIETDDFDHNIELGLKALRSLKNDLEEDKYYRILKKERAVYLSLRVNSYNSKKTAAKKEAARLKHEARLAALKRMKEEKNAAKRADIRAELDKIVSRGDIEVRDSGHALVIAIRELIDDKHLHQMIFQRASDLTKSLPKRLRPATSSIDQYIEHDQSIKDKGPERQTESEHDPELDSLPIGDIHTPQS